MRKKNGLVFLGAASALSLVGSGAQAAIVLTGGAGGGVGTPSVESWTSLPPTSSWSTGNIAGAGTTATVGGGLNCTTVAQIDAVVTGFATSANAASGFGQALAADFTGAQSALGSNNGARRMTGAGGSTTTLPVPSLSLFDTGNAVQGLMASTTNGDTNTITSVAVSYKFDLAYPAIANPGEASEANGLVTYYSTTGAAGSFIRVGGVQGHMGNATTPPAASTEGFTVDLTGLPGGGLAPGGNLFLLWVDDNAQTNPDAAYLLDDVSLTATTTPEPASLGLLGVGALGLLARKRRKA